MVYRRQKIRKQTSPAILNSIPPPDKFATSVATIKKKPFKASYFKDFVLYFENS